MKQKILLYSILILSLFAQVSLAQTAGKTPQVAVKKQVPTKPYVAPRKYVDTIKNTDFTLNGQYRFLLSRSRSSYGAKLINPVKLDALWKSVNDTLRKERVELKNAKAKLTEQEKTIANLQAEISGKETSLNNTTAKADEISFLGISFTKGTYSIMVWSIIIILALALFIVIARSAKNILEAKHRTQLYDEVTAEYQSYKAKASEKERKLARELQDERNTIEEMRSKGK